MDVIRDVRVRGDGYIPHSNILKRKSSLFFFLIANTDTPEETSNQKVISDGTLEEEFMFVGLCSALYLIGNHMSYHNGKGMWQRMMSTKNLPVFEDEEKYIYSLSNFLELSFFCRQSDSRRVLSQPRRQFINRWTFYLTYLDFYKIHHE